MAKRYQQKKKDEVVAFVNRHNTEHGRGGQTVAAKKFGITAITIASWLKQADGTPTAEKEASPKEDTGSAVAEKAVAKRTVTSPVSVVLKKMMSIQEEIESLQGEYEDLRGQI